MKLIVCSACYDVVALSFPKGGPVGVPRGRACECGQSGGHYVDNHTVEVYGPCRVIGLANEIRYGTVDRAETWVIREPHHRVRRYDGPLAAPLARWRGGERGR